jgi:hypothetical protein
MYFTLRSNGSLPGSWPMFFVLIASIFLWSCTPLSTTNRYFPVENRDQRASSLGFSIAPPTGVNWYEKLNDKSLYYLKKIKTDNYSIYTKATEIHLDSSMLNVDRFLQYVKIAKELNPTTQDYRNVSSRFTLNKDLSPLCVRYVQDYEDHGDKNSKNNEYIRVQKSGLVCMHPETPENGVDMFYVESFRQSPSNRDHSYKDEGEFFLSSLKFHSSAQMR